MNTMSLSLEWINGIRKLGCIELVSMCDAVYFLKGWQYSPGANIEHIVATKFNLARYYEDGNSVIPAKEKE